MPASACAAAQGRHAADRARKRDAEVETGTVLVTRVRVYRRLEKDRRRLTCASYMRLERRCPACPTWMPPLMPTAMPRLDSFPSVVGA